MTGKIIPLILKNLTRNKVRLFVTTGCCLIAGLIVGFSLMAEQSLSGMMQNTGDGLNLVMTQKDRY